MSVSGILKRSHAKRARVHDMCSTPYLRTRLDVIGHGEPKFAYTDMSDFVKKLYERRAESARRGEFSEPDCFLYVRSILYHNPIEPYEVRAETRARVSAMYDELEKLIEDATFWSNMLANRMKKRPFSGMVFDDPEEWESGAVHLSEMRDAPDDVIEPPEPPMHDVRVASNKRVRVDAKADARAMKEAALTLVSLETIAARNQASSQMNAVEDFASGWANEFSVAPKSWVVEVEKLERRAWEGATGQELQMKDLITQKIAYEGVTDYPDPGVVSGAVPRVVSYAELQTMSVKTLRDVLRWHVRQRANRKKDEFITLCSQKAMEIYMLLLQEENYLLSDDNARAVDLAVRVLPRDKNELCSVYVYRAIDRTLQHFADFEWSVSIGRMGFRTFVSDFIYNPEDGTDPEPVARVYVELYEHYVEANAGDVQAARDALLAANINSLRRVESIGLGELSTKDLRRVTVERLINRGA